MSIRWCAVLCLSRRPAWDAGPWAELRALNLGLMVRMSSAVADVSCKIQIFVPAMGRRTGWGLVGEAGRVDGVGGELVVLRHPQDESACSPTER